VSPEADGRIGPNAVTRLAEALDELHGPPATDAVFGAAGLLRYRQTPPVALVDETVVTSLHAALRDVLTPGDAAAVARRAGALTGDYLLAHRIPAPVRALLRALPAPWSARLLVRAMASHAWTFAGSGAFSSVTISGRLGPGAQTSPQRDDRPGRARLELAVRSCPLCRGASAPVPLCDYFASTFERLFVALVSRSARVHESTCEATGASACRFEVRW
jgi:divinyl protochlorophyllide a 8-vinyl-reductase